MKHLWLQRSHSDKLRVLALGWGQDAAAWRDLPWPDDADLLCLYQWDDPADLPPLDAWSHVELLAWSFGVREVAAIAWPLRITRAVAINGTLHPVDDLRGIPVAIFSGTLAHWQPGASAAKFRRRMGRPEEQTPHRTDDSLLRELQYFDRQFHRDRPLTLRYDLAVVGRKDRIFPPDNQLAAWREAGVPVRETDLPHHPGAAITEWVDLER